MYIPIQLLEEDELDLRRVFFGGGGGTAVLEYDESVGQTNYALAPAGSSLNSGALITALNALSQDCAGSTTNSGAITSFNVGLNDMDGITQSSGALIAVIIGYNLDMDGQSENSGSLQITISIGLAGASLNSGAMVPPTYFAVLTGSSTNSGAITDNTKIESSGFETEILPALLGSGVL